MLPLVKKGQWVSYRISKIENISKVFQSNPKSVWIETENGRIMKLHKRRHFVKVVEEPKAEGRKERKPKKLLDDLFDDLIPGPTSS